MKRRILMVTVALVASILSTGILYAASGDLSVNGNATVSGSTTLNGNTVINGNLGVGISTPQGKAEINGNLTVDGNLTVLGNVNGNKITSSPTGTSIPVSQQNGTLAEGWIPPFPRSLTASGYQKLSSGLIIQWGSFTGSTAVVFPVAFTTTVFFCGMQMYSSTDRTTQVTSLTNSGFTPLVVDGLNRLTADSGKYLAVGY